MAAIVFEYGFYSGTYFKTLKFGLKIGYERGIACNIIPRQNIIVECLMKKRYRARIRYKYAAACEICEGPLTGGAGLPYGLKVSEDLIHAAILKRTSSS